MTSQWLLPGDGEVAGFARALGEAIELFAERRLLGLTWLDADMVALASYGALADFVPLNATVTDAVAPLIGLHDVLLELKSQPGNAAPFEMPNVALVGPSGSTPRMDLQVYWLPARQQFLLAVTKVLSTGELEIGLAQQVRKRMIAEAELAQKSRELVVANAELTRANRDLAEFAYVISHDLKAPLRAMRYHADDLESGLPDNTDGAVRALASQIRSQSRRMARMLTDLLAYSKIGREVEALEPVDTAALVEGIVASIPRPAGMLVTISGDWPRLDTFAAPLDLVLRNLIGNAIAHHDQAEGHIVITCALADDAIEIAVADDGPGIPSDWHDAIFLPFRTIRETSGSDSSGIGLALVRRTAESVGARLNLVSDPTIARGTTFNVRWPLVITA